MSIAAKQLREDLEEMFPGIRIGRYSCRDTAGGSISQHSAKASGEYDSNALDIMGGPHGWSWDENVALIQQVVNYVRAHLHDYSVNQVLWQVPDHFGHAHIDFSPMCVVHTWCGKTPTTQWEYSDGRPLTASIPEPENGRYEREAEMALTLRRWVDMIRVEDLEQMGVVGILTDSEVPYYVDMMKKYKKKEQTFEAQEPDWQNCHDAYLARADLWV